MIERPFRADAREVNGLRDKSITCLMRAIEPQPVFPHGEFPSDAYWLSYGGVSFGLRLRRCDGDYPFDVMHLSDLPCGVPGDRLWVQEEHAVIQTGHSTINAVQQQVPYDPAAVYRADGHDTVADAIADTVLISEVKGWQAEDSEWQSAEQMPQWASRITLEVVKVRVVRVRDLSEEDVLAMGCCRFKDDGEWGSGGYWFSFAGQQYKYGSANIALLDLMDATANSWFWLATVAKVESK